MARGNQRDLARAKADKKVLGLTSAAEASKGKRNDGAAAMTPAQRREYDLANMAKAQAEREARKAAKDEKDKLKEKKAKAALQV